MQEQPTAGTVAQIPIPAEIPILPSRDTLVFPFMLAPLAIGRPKSVRMLDAEASQRPILGVFLQKDSATEDPTPDQIESIGTAVQIVRLIRLPDGTIQLLVQGVARIRVLEVTQTEPYLKGRVEVIEEVTPDVPEVAALARSLLNQFRRTVELAPNLPAELANAAADISEPGRLADFVAATVTLTTAERYQILSTENVLDRLRTLVGFITRELEVLELGNKIQEQIKGEIDKGQREYYLRQQLQAIRRELGEVDEREAEADEIRRQIEEANLPEEARKEAERELERLSRLPAGSPEQGMIRNYLDWLASLPWSISTTDNLDIARARKVLDEDHYDLEKVKDRILEYLAVRRLKEDMRGPILCFVGPPGVGKTSLGQSIARALERKFVRISLGGVRDEAEIRGHRRTYIGALPGRIIQGLRRAGSRNPVFMLDEIDKLGISFQGDPASALLEVLDPAQNNSFVDHYINLPFDLSSVLFVATANQLDTIPPALLDRMEVIQLPGYSENEKLEIAKRYIVPRQLKEHGLKASQLRFTDDALQVIITQYTREAGVRNLEREIGTVARKAARAIAEGEKSRIRVSAKNVSEFLGRRRFRPEAIEQADEVGVATGLAWTPVGGDVLFVEASAVPGKGGLILTGHLGEVMQESAKAALTYIRSRADQLGLPEDFQSKFDIHVHVPAGAIAKDGPSAGITMATAMTSALTRRKVKRDVAMTGEITLRGKVLPIGGVKEKVLAAHRAGAKTVILPEENEKDYDEVPEAVRQDLKVEFVNHMDQVLDLALQPPGPALAETAASTVAADGRRVTAGARSRAVARQRAI